MPGVITAAPTRAEAEELLLDALREFLMSFADENGSEAPADSPDTQRLQIVLSA